MARTPIHPGDHLAEELRALEMSAAEVARQLRARAGLARAAAEIKANTGRQTREVSTGAGYWSWREIARAAGPS
jgi:plasmid maintenance system antidote protein VapI